MQAGKQLLLFPQMRPRPALGAQRRRRKSHRAAFVALLKQQLLVVYALPEWSRIRIADGDGESAHCGSLPMVTAQPVVTPNPVASATRAPSTCRLPAWPRSWLTISTAPLRPWTYASLSIPPWG